MFEKNKKKQVVKKTPIKRKRSEKDAFLKINDGDIIRKESLKGYHRDKYDKNGCHYYIAKFDSKKDIYILYPTSHYVDPKKVSDVKNGRAILMNIKGIDGLSTVYKPPRTKDVNKQPIKSIEKYIKVGELSKRQSKRLDEFVDNKKRKAQNRTFPKES